MGTTTSHRLQQVYVPRSGKGYESIACFNVENTILARDHETARSSLERLCTADKWGKNSHSTYCPLPILVTRQHEKQLSDLHEALVLAIVDIVQRWWQDPIARFPERMPLEPKEEDLLRWIDSQDSGIIAPFRDRLGSWRPDFLLEQENSEGTSTTVDSIRVSEINARFSFNGFMFAAHGSQALQDIGVANENNGLVCATDPDKILGGLLRLFRHDHPLYILKNEEPGMDIHMFVEYIQQNLEITPRFIKPSELRLLPDAEREGEYKLYCVVKAIDNSASETSALTNSIGEHLQEIHQVGLELHQRELLALKPEMLRQLSLRCFNDMRTILLVHDKRMLGIVKQELGPLTERGVLTPAQAETLDKGIADTILPGSTELGRLLRSSRECPGLKAEYILKPIRSGKGNGIVFGEDLTSAAWVSELENLRCPEPEARKRLYVVQRKIKQLLYDVMLRGSGEKVKYPLIGTYHSIAGEYLGLGVWRSSADRICAISHGGTWMSTVIKYE